MKGIDKALAPIGGVPLLLRTVEALARAERITDILVVTREDLIPEVSRLCAHISKLSGMIVGGSSRSESVCKGLREAKGELVAIHDGARPFVTAELIDRTVATAEEFGGAAPGLPVKDTIKIVQGTRVQSTPDRSTLFGVQTPQVFFRKEILHALTEATERGIPLTDDCSAAEAMGMTVVLTEGLEENIKITTPVDLILGEAILKRRSEA